MSTSHDQARELELVRAIRQMRAVASADNDLGKLEEEIVVRFEADIAETARKVRGKYRNYRIDQQDPPEQGDLENRLTHLLLQNAVDEYDPLKNDSFAMFVFSGWRTEKGGCIQQYLKRFRLPEVNVLGRDGKPKRDAKGKLIKKPIRMGSLDRPTRTADGESGSLGQIIPQDRQVVGGRLAKRASHDIFEMWQDLEVIADGVCLANGEALSILGPLLKPKCKPEDLRRRSGHEKCTCPGCTSNEHLRRKAMILLLRYDVSFPDCSDEFQRRQWWNSLVDGSG